MLESQEFPSVRQLLAEHFRDSQHVGFLRVELGDESRRPIERRLGGRLPRERYTFYVATSGSRVDGYALFDSEKGQHEMIDLAIFFDAQGAVKRVEVLAYREAYGDGIRAARFRSQFVGRNDHSSYRVGDDIDIVSGATISCRSMARAVQRAAVLLHETVLTDEASTRRASL
jgi:Na+-translocating ferredoxin:NAD+ oxidoreductase RnfG subunit